MWYILAENIYFLRFFMCLVLMYDLLRPQSSNRPSSNHRFLIYQHFSDLRVCDQVKFGCCLIAQLLELAPAQL